MRRNGLGDVVRTAGARLAALALAGLGGPVLAQPSPASAAASAAASAPSGVAAGGQIAAAPPAASAALAALPLSPADRVWIVMAVMLLMGGLFYVLFRWQQQIEQSGYFAGIYTDAVRKVEVMRLAGPAHERWASGEYLREIFQRRSARGRAWLEMAGNARPLPDEALRTLAASLGPAHRMRLRDAERLTEEMPVLREGGGSNPFAGGWAGSRVGNLGASRDGANRGAAATAAEEQEQQFQSLLDRYADAAAAWSDRAACQAGDWYQADLAQADADARGSARLALNVDFSALRGRGPEFVLEFTAVVVIIFAAVILGVLDRLGSEQIGTLLAAIAGYVLGKGTSRGRAAAEPAAVAAAGPATGAAAGATK